MAVFLREIQLLKSKLKKAKRTEYPFCISAIQTLDSLTFDSPVTFFVGENGSGKSTIMEAIADQCGFHTAGGSRDHTYNVHQSESILGEYIRLSWFPKVTNGFFLRAESFYHFATYIDDVHQRSGSYERYGGRSLLEQSHGESFLSLFAHRFDEKGLYLLDEPEAALSPQRQLAFLRLIHDLVKQNHAQFIIATHSPIVLTYPGAKIYNFDSVPISETQYEDTSHYFITKRVINDHDQFIKELLD
ncbi:AAA family ATPase [Desmospora profundinema]|uniref:ATPase n=1 Tax=Desmospora profundinema TaxID=1571184 RepID=A0ABU1IJH2_9BACL|nr:AAA family ATPase [Desmospora profundinema]MDR6224929.1 putative ATPase [Desmospora profundinema]